MNRGEEVPSEKAGVAGNRETQDSLRSNRIESLYKRSREAGLFVESRRNQEVMLER